MDIFIARDEDGKLFMFLQKPELREVNRMFLDVNPKSTTKTWTTHESENLLFLGIAGFPEIKPCECRHFREITKGDDK